MRYAVLTLALILTGCQTSGNQPLEETSVAPSVYVDEYLVGVGDVLSVNVWRNPELSVNVPVRPDGKISMPLIGDVDASGFTPEQVAQNIRESLAAYVRDPQVSVIVTAINSSDYVNRVRVTGAVRNPSSLPYQTGMTVLDVILESGGPNEFAAIDSATLYRGQRAYQIKLRDILERGKLETNYALLPGDVITIGERAF